MLKKSIFLSLTFLWIVGSSFAQIPSLLKGVEVLVTITFDDAKGIYMYSYTIVNPSINDGKVAHFDIDITKKSQDAILSREGLVNGPRYTRHGSEYNFQNIPMVPVGIDGPSGWIYGLARTGTASWGASEANMILPGQSLGGFILISRGLPGIREVSLQPDYIPTEEDIFKMGISEREYIENTWEVLNRIYESITYHTKTIGPTAPPADFKPIEYLDYIINLKHEAFSLGWITNKGVENSLDTKLENARKKLKQGDIIAARNILNALINEVEAQGCRTYDDCPTGKHLTPEAYALLKYNTQYLINNLK